MDYVQFAKSGGAEKLSMVSVARCVELNFKLPHPKKKIQNVCHGKRNALLKFQLQRSKIAGDMDGNVRVIH